QSDGTPAVFHASGPMCNPPGLLRGNYIRDSRVEPEAALGSDRRGARVHAAELVVVFFIRQMQFDYPGVVLLERLDEKRLQEKTSFQIDQDDLGSRFPRLQKVRNHTGALVRTSRPTIGIRWRRDQHHP